MKQIFKVLMFLAIGVFLFGGQAFATSIDFNGTYGLNDSDGDGFSESLVLDTGSIKIYSPDTDAIFNDDGEETIEFAELTLSSSTGDYVTGSYYSFDPTIYSDGFKIYDDDGSLLMGADLTVISLDVTNSTGTINSALTMNLTDIYVTSAGLNSEILSAFLTEGGAVTITLQVSGDLSDAIESGETIKSTYSGSATSVPEPATMLLFGAGLIGLAAVGRRKFIK